VLTKDFANKLMRVLTDLDRANNGKEVAQWISKFGQDTLTAPLVKFRIEPDKERLDNLVHHRQQCIHSLTLEQNAAIVIRRLMPTDPYARQHTNIILSRIMTGFEASDFGSNLPTVLSARMVLYNPQSFRMPSRFRTTKDMVVMFLSDSSFKYRLKLQDTGWKTPGVHHVILLYEEVDFWVAPHRASARPEPSHTLGDGTMVRLWGLRCF
jgi:hypothetical protein